MYDPAKQEAEVVASGLWFPNGIALAPDSSYAVVVETNTMRLHRVWLTGPKVSLG